MKEGILNFQSIFISLSGSLIVASFIGFLLLPFCLKKIGIQKSQRQTIAKLSTLFLFVIVFSLHRKMFS